MHTHHRVISFPRMVIFFTQIPLINQIATPRHRHLRITEKSPTNYLVNRIILVTCGCKPFSGAPAHSRRPETHNTATMKRRLSIILALVAATVITALAHSSPVLGNVRSVVREDGAVVESNEYYPYGGLFSSTPSVQPYKYGAKELDRTHGLDWYDSQARWVNPMSGMTSTMDRLAEKYYHLSPHLWCGGNPIKNIDENGDTLAVLHEFMHIALLVKQNGNWSYYSVNGNNVYISGSLSSSSRYDSGSFCGRKKVNDDGEMTFETFENFFYDRTNPESTYSEAYIIFTSNDEDTKIINTFMKISKSKYSLCTNNCATAVAKSLESAGIKTNLPFVNKSSYIPGWLFNCIILNNIDNGKYICK